MKDTYINYILKNWIVIFTSAAIQNVTLCVTLKRTEHQTIQFVPNVKLALSLPEKLLKVIQRLNLGLVLITQNVNTLKVKISRSQKGLNALNVVKVY